MFKNNGGFTLVELIVVIAILAILAGVAVPAYSAYINNANKTADIAKIEAIETAMASALSMNGKSDSNANAYFKVTFDATTKTLKVENAETTATEVGTKIWNNFTSFYGATTCEEELSYFTAVTDNDDTTDNDVPAILNVKAVAPAA